MRNIYMLTSAGWQHFGTGRVVQSGGISLDAADIQALKQLHLKGSSLKRSGKRADGEKRSSQNSPNRTARKL